MAGFKLFGGTETLLDRLHLAVTEAKREVARIPDEQLESVNESQLIEQLCSRAAILPLKLEFENERVSQQEVPVDVSNDFLRGGPAAPGTIIVDGFRLSIHIPFTGNPSLFYLRPNSFGMRRPHGDVESQGEDGGAVVFRVETPADLDEDELVNKLRQKKEDNTRLLTRYVDFMNADVDTYNAKLKEEISVELQRRKERRNRGQRVRDAFGISTTEAQISNRRPSPRLPTAQREVSVHPSGASEEQRDFFISHASEDKDFVRQLVVALRALGATVWFDEYEIQVGDSLRVKIDQGLKTSAYGVVVVSPRLIQKRERGWIQRELGGSMARDEKDRPVILPVWYETTASEVADEMPTLADTAALVAATTTVESIASALWKRKLSDEK